MLFENGDLLLLVRDLFLLMCGLFPLRGDLVVPLSDDRQKRIHRRCALVDRDDRQTWNVRAHDQ